VVTNNIINLQEAGMTSYDGAGVFHGRTLTQPAAGITISNATGVAGNPTLALSDDLAALEGLGTTGIAARTGTSTWATRTITAGTGVSITNGDGIAGNPTISATSAVPTTFTTDSGVATPAANNLNIVGTAAQGISSSGSGSTVTLTVANATTSQKGVVALATNAEAIAGTDTAKAITADDLKAKLGAQTLHGVSVGAGTTGALAWTAAGTNGQVLVGSSAADPVFSTLTSSDSSVSFTTGAGTLSLQVAGGTTVGKTITGDSGGALSPTAGNWNLLGTGSITTSGSGSSLTTQLTGLTNHAVLVGAGTATITKVGPTATAGQVLQSAGAAADPVFSTATYPSTTTINQVLYSSANNVVSAITAANNGTMISSATGVPSLLANGATGEVLTATTGSPPSWQALPSGGFTTINIQSFTASGTYTPTSGMKYCLVEAVAGGGGGGGANTTGASQVTCGGGGGGGSYRYGYFTAADIGASKAVVIGGAGAAGSSGGGTGGTGGSTALTGLFSIDGGLGGTGNATPAASSAAQGGVGGNPTSAGIQAFGASGSSGSNGCASNAGLFAMGGVGGSSYFGSGGRGGVTTTTRSAGVNGLTYGGGGGGAAVAASQSGFVGGTGGAGFLVVTEFI